MSYDVALTDPVTGEGKTFDELHFLRGGTYNPKGTYEAWLNVTYNYGPIISKVLDGGIYGLSGKVAGDTVPALEEATEQLGDDNSKDYWEATEGNAKAALLQLLELARRCPDAVWRVT